MNARPAMTSPVNFSFAVRVVRSHWPVHKPSTIVASVGMKLSVDQPPRLKRNGSRRGNRFKNQVSNAHDTFAFLLKCAKKPE